MLKCLKGTTEIHLTLWTPESWIGEKNNKSHMPKEAIMFGKQYAVGVNRLASVVRSLAIACVLVLVLTTMLALSAAAQYSVVYNFTGGLDGANPVLSLTLNQGGSLFGTIPGGSNSPGSVYELRYVNSGWIFAPLYSFQGTDGAGPAAAVTLAPNGVVYGSTQSGGATNQGVVYMLRPSPTPPLTPLAPWNETMLDSFPGVPDGAGPTGKLVLDSAGNLYGTTYQGGSYGKGDVYELSPTSNGWVESVLYSFSGGTDGGMPDSGVVIDSAGNLYGTAIMGGDPSCQCGVVFQLTPSSSGWNETVLYSFQPADGGIPIAGLAWDSSGNLYGGTCELGKSLDHRTGLGGTVKSQSRRSSGGGISTVFQLGLFGGQWVYFNLYTFNDSTCIFDHLAVDVVGAVWGTSPTAGTYGAGKLFWLLQENGLWQYGEAYDFTGGTDGGMPYAGPSISPLGYVYGAAYGGGSYNEGVIYQFTY
jgi:uncharacterized repeat protein (TIGR03803 family)